MIPPSRCLGEIMPYAALILLAGLWGPATPAQVLTGADAYGDFTKDAPGVRRHIAPGDLPAPYTGAIKANMSSVVSQPAGATLQVPPGFKVEPFAQLKRPRVIRVAPNGDILIAQTGIDQVSILRASDGASKPSETEVFASHLNSPFGIAFYPAGPNPQVKIFLLYFDPARITRLGHSRFVIFTAGKGRYFGFWVVMSSFSCSGGL